MIDIKPSSLLTVSARRTRALAVVLLASLAWGATAEFTHNHARQPFTTPTPRSLALDQSGSAQFQSTSGNDTSSTSKSGIECLICQLHQNLSATDLDYCHSAANVEAQISLSRARLVFKQSDLSLNRQGRAPPTIL